MVGLTTAATIWAAAGIGMAAGTGKYILAVAACIITLIVLLLPHLHRPQKEDEENIAKD